MSIDKDAFLAGIAVLAGAFGREIDAPVQRAYFAVLNSALSTEEYERAVQLALTSETFWPSPAVLLSKVKADDATRGLLAFEHVGRVTSAHGGYRFLPNAVYQAEFDAPTRAAISAVGGLLEIANTRDDHYQALKRRFAAAYAEALKPKQLAPPPPTDPRVKQLVGATARLLSSGRDRAAGRDP